jgi:hypothetical protein
MQGTSVKHRKEPSSAVPKSHALRNPETRSMAGLARDYTPADMSAYATLRLRQALALLEKYSKKRRLPLALSFEKWFDNPVVRAGEQIALFEVLHAPAKRGRPSRKPIPDATLSSRELWTGLPGLGAAALKRALRGEPTRRPKSGRSPGRPKKWTDDELLDYADKFDALKHYYSDDLNCRFSDWQTVDRFLSHLYKRTDKAVNSQKAFRAEVSRWCNLLKKARKRRTEIAS